MKTLINNQVIAQLRENWQLLPTARQHVLLIALACLALGLIWALIYQPIQASRAVNTARISALQSSLSQIERDSAELKKLETIAPVADKNSKANADSARLEALYGPSSNVTVLADGRFQITTSNTQYADWLTKTDDALSRFNVAISEVKLNRALGNAEKVVNATLTLKVTR